MVLFVNLLLEAAQPAVVSGLVVEEGGTYSHNKSLFSGQSDEWHKPNLY